MRFDLLITFGQARFDFIGHWLLICPSGLEYLLFKSCKESPTPQKSGIKKPLFLNWIYFKNKVGFIAQVTLWAKVPQYVFRVCSLQWFLLFFMLLNGSCIPWIFYGVKTLILLRIHLSDIFLPTNKNLIENIYNFYLQKSSFLHVINYILMWPKLKTNLFYLF